MTLGSVATVRRWLGYKGAYEYFTARANQPGTSASARDFFNHSAATVARLGGL